MLHLGACPGSSPHLSAKMTIELLKTQMDSLKLELHSLEVSNLKLRCQVEELSQELAKSEDEKAALEEEFKEKTLLYRQQLQGMPVAEGEGLPEQCAAMEKEVSELKQLLEEKSQKLEEEEACVKKLEEELNVQTVALAEEKTHSTQVEQELQEFARAAEFSRCCAILGEARKWEAREARLVRQLESLERRASIQAAIATREPTVLPTTLPSAVEDSDASTLSALSAMSPRGEGAIVVPTLPESALTTAGLPTTMTGHSQVMPLVQRSLCVLSSQAQPLMTSSVPTVPAAEPVLRQHGSTPYSLQPPSSLRTVPPCVPSGSLSAHALPFVPGPYSLTQPVVGVSSGSCGTRHPTVEPSSSRRVSVTAQPTTATSTPIPSLPSSRTGGGC